MDETFLDVGFYYISNWFDIPTRSIPISLGILWGVVPGSVMV